MFFKNDNMKKLLRDIKIKDVMAKPVITVNEKDDFSLVQEKMSLYDIRHIPVVNDAGVVVGMITQRNLYKIHSPRKLEDGSWYYDKEALNQFILKSVMEKDPFTLKEDQSLYEAISATVQHKFGCIPIVDDYKMIRGILTRDGILKYLIQ